MEPHVAAQGIGVLLLVSSGTELWSWEGRVRWAALATSRGGLEKQQSCCRESVSEALWGAAAPL